MAYRLLLINPKRHGRYQWDVKEICMVFGKKAPTTPLALPLLAALTPPHYDIRIIDEELEEIPSDIPADLVGITVLVSNTHRAFEIADRLRYRGIPVIFGGPEALYNTECVMRHADSVVAGEAELVWHHVLEDFENRRLKPFYRADGFCEFKHSPIPRWDLVNIRKIIAPVVQVSRGCPFRCEFCLVRSMFGGTQRYRDIDNVIDEIRTTGARRITFADDNLTSDKKYARTLFERLIPLEISWSCQASIEIAYDTDLLGLMKRAGCTSLFIGFESVDQHSLSEAHKLHNDTARYGEAIRNIHAHGITISASFIAGFDSDTPDIFDRIFEFTRQNNLCYPIISLLGALPGSDLYDRMRREDRVVPIDHRLINGLAPTMHYMHMSQGDITTRCCRTLARMYDYDAVTEKAVRLFGEGSFTAPSRAAGVNIATRIRAVSYLLWILVITGDRKSRRFFFTMIGLARSGKAPIATVMETMMLVSSFHGFLRYLDKRLDSLLEIIAQTDRGPWYEQQKKHPPASGKPALADGQAPA